MSQTNYRILGQNFPAAAAAPAIIVTAPTTGAGKAVVCANLNACNKGGAGDTIRVAVLPLADVAGGIQDRHWAVYDMPVASKDFLPMKLSIALAPGDQIRTYSLLGTTSFHAYGFDFVNS